MSLKDQIQTVHHTALSVRDFELMRDFLTGFIGFELEGEMDNRGEEALGTVVGLPGCKIRWAMLRFGAHRIELFKYYTPEGATGVERQCDRGFTHLAFQVSNVDVVHEAAVSAGHLPISAPQVMRGGATKAFYLHGPENVVFEFIEFPQKGAEA
ncbi:VOC family protein [Sulfitobacter aestuarii]|uniref:VOC family protein n=1 Tax=Sulfitobacter aestuarii TaxID=2161676 RepID=A0ABW5U7S4_9RHOB